MSDSLDFEEYQERAAETAVYPGRDNGPMYLAPYPCLGLAGEAGEVAEHAKKAIRDDGGMVSQARRAKLKKELGDVLWYIAAICDELGLSMADVAQANIDKLADRQERGAIRGEGDER